MAKKICFDTNYFILIIIIIILLSYFLIIHYNNQNNQNNYFNKNENNDINDNNQNNYFNKNINNDINNDINKINIKNKEIENYNNSKPIIGSINYPTAVIDSNSKTINSLDRIYNPLRYPYKSDYFYDQSWYPNLEIPFQVIGCGSRNTPCLGGTQIPIYNPPVAINISNENIAPVNISTRGPLGKPQQLGVLYKINGNDNDILPLFGRRKYPNDSKYEYYTIVGSFGSKVNIVTKNRNDELGSNDIVFIKGRPSPYRVTIYESDFPQYIPY